mmetsp:Transcript_6225/g.12302  ORF Transcript_6225/g.12302 Transcript_6225/m.12302 type:complete len:513 (-) Transcript_6225:820-2358(-)
MVGFVSSGFCTGVVYGGERKRVCGGRRVVVHGKVDGGDGGEENSGKGVVESAREFLLGLRRLAGLEQRSRLDNFENDVLGLQFSSVVSERDDEDRGDEQGPPTVLVVGATGRTGRIIVRKLLLRGFRVRALVRDLFSSTLDLLGSGVDFVKGDLRNPQSLAQAVIEVDKVVCCVGTDSRDEAEDVELEGVKNLIRVFEDSRYLDFGREGSTKTSLFKFGRGTDVLAWRNIEDHSAPSVYNPSQFRFDQNRFKHAIFTGRVLDRYNGSATVGANLGERGACLWDSSGLILRVIGDGKVYSVILKAGKIQYISSFSTVEGKWITVRLPFSTFKPMRPRLGQLTDPAEEKLLVRSEIEEIQIRYQKPEVSPEKDEGRFYLALDYIKAYRTQEEPDFVFVSSAEVAVTKQGEEANVRFKTRAEDYLRESGLTYCIIRPGTLTDQPGGRRALLLQQDSEASQGQISRADLAEVCVSSLLDPRACNLTFEAFESRYAPTASVPTKELSLLFERLRPNV